LLTKSLKTPIKIKEMQFQMTQSEKMASVGQLAAGVAHEINTPVGFVASNFQTLEDYMRSFLKLLEIYEQLTAAVENGTRKDRMEKEKQIQRIRDEMHIDFILEDIQELFDDSKKGLERIANIIQNLRDFSRVDQAEDFTEFNLNDGIESTPMVANNEIKYDADVKTEFSEVPLIFCNSSQINQVFLNILVNAAQAIKSHEQSERRIIAIKTYTTNQKVLCEIFDNDPGLPQDKLTKVFDPFFTTKPVGKGAGLGLSVSYYC